MNLSFHLDFNGQCKQAFDYYAKHLGGKIGTMLLFKNSPATNSVADEWQDKVIHANIRIGNIELAGTDLTTEQYRKPRGFYVLLGLNSEAEVDSVFGKLSVDGEVLLPPQATFWSKRYGIVVDQFNIPWKVNCRV